MGIVGRGAKVDAAPESNEITMKARVPPTKHEGGPALVGEREIADLDRALLANAHDPHGGNEGT